MWSLRATSTSIPSTTATALCQLCVWLCVNYRLLTFLDTLLAVMYASQKANHKKMCLHSFFLFRSVEMWCIDIHIDQIEEGQKPRQNK